MSLRGSCEVTHTNMCVCVCVALDDPCLNKHLVQTRLRV